MGIYNSLAYIINICLGERIFPTMLELAIVQPLFNKGDSTMYENYRAINLLSSVSKVIELVIKKPLASFLSLNNLLSNLQHGFTSNRSTETALCVFHHKIINTLNSKKCVLGLFIDFSRAFDCFDHQLLKAKLCRYGVRGTQFDLLSSYLKDRKQLVHPAIV